MYVHVLGMGTSTTYTRMQRPTSLVHVAEACCPCVDAHMRVGSSCTEAQLATLIAANTPIRSPYDTQTHTTTQAP